MLPATNASGPSLAAVLPSCVGALRGVENALGLPAVDKAVVLLADGLGTAALKARMGHARTLAAALSKRASIRAGFPTTTAANIATLTTGTTPGVHGLVGYTALDYAHDRIVNQLSGWDDRLVPETWQRSPTVFETASDSSVQSFAVGQERYRHSGFTRAVLRGAEYRSGASIADRFDAAREVLDTTEQSLVYLYVPELDQAAHAHGVHSDRWIQRLEELDGVLARFIRTLGRREGLLVTADHGVLDVPEHSHVLFGSEPGLVDGIRFVAGEPRCLQLHFEPDAGAPLRAAVLERWRDAEGHQSDVVTREEAIAAGWFGERVDAEVAPRIGDIVIAARKAIAYYDARDATQFGRTMVGQHGSLSPEEMWVPLLRFGAFGAR